jgi:hypothetical protein
MFRALCRTCFPPTSYLAPSAPRLISVSVSPCSVLPMPLPFHFPLLLPSTLLARLGTDDSVFTWLPFAEYSVVTPFIVRLEKSRSQPGHPETRNYRSLIGKRFNADKKMIMEHRECNSRMASIAGSTQPEKMPQTEGKPSGKCPRKKPKRTQDATAVNHQSRKRGKWKEKSVEKECVVDHQIRHD